MVEEEDGDEYDDKEGHGIGVGGNGGHKQTPDEPTIHKEDEKDVLGGGRDHIEPEIDEDDEDLKTEVEITHENSSNIHLSNTSIPIRIVLLHILCHVGLTN